MLQQKDFDYVVGYVKKIPNLTKESLIDCAIEMIRQRTVHLRDDKISPKLAGKRKEWCEEINFFAAVIARLTNTHPNSARDYQVGCFLAEVGLSGYERDDEYVPVTPEVLRKFQNGEISQEEFLVAGRLPAKKQR